MLFELNMENSENCAAILLVKVHINSQGEIKVYLNPRRYAQLLLSAENHEIRNSLIDNLCLLTNLPMSYEAAKFRRGYKYNINTFIEETMDNIVKDFELKKIIKSDAVLREKIKPKNDL